MDPALFNRGLRDGLAGAKTLLTPEEVRAAIAGLQNEQKQKVLAKNKQDGDSFLTANKAKPEVVSLASGLQYKILRPGAGRKPSADDTVVCNYRVIGLDGTEIDSSYARNQPVTFPVKTAIQAWVEALQLMPAGSKWQLFAPPNLTSVAGREPPSNATLIFEVELLAIAKRS
jgi:FKBP-type peptidyl-prolyl cis-trans isomerase